jgi:two-component system cell cycle sensor histidine kinase/response regulator CckA
VTEEPVLLAQLGELREQLQRSHEMIRALIAGEVDAVAETSEGEPALLRQAQAALRESETRLRAVFDGALDAMLIIDDDGRYIDANPAALELFGVTREQLLGKSAVDFGEPADYDAAWAAFLAAGQAEGEFHLVRPDGQRRTLEFRAKARISPGRHLSSLHDVTDKRRLEEELRQSHRLESLGRLAGGIAHDFNNMLLAITGFATFVHNELPEGDPKREDQAEVLRAAARAADLVRQLLAFGRKQMLTPKAVTAGQVVADVTGMTRRLIREDIELVVRHGADAALVCVDAPQIEQVLVNLVVNARDAMPDGGSITLDTATATIVSRVSSPEAEGLSPGNYCVISVTDTGVGMDEDTRSRVFEPFFSTKERGESTGLGLATAYGIVKQSGGHIEVESALGRGSTFRIYLPVCEVGVQTVRPMSPAPAELRGCETILVVEDEPMVRRLAVEVLRRHGYRVLEARDPGDALLVVEQEADRIDLLLTDVVMPRMSGPQLAQRITVSQADMRVVFMSGYVDDQLTDDRSELLVAKPFTPQDLLLAIRRALDG